MLSCARFRVPSGTLIGMRGRRLLHDLLGGATWRTPQREALRCNRRVYHSENEVKPEYSGNCRVSAMKPSALKQTHCSMCKTPTAAACLLSASCLHLPLISTLGAYDCIRYVGVSGGRLLTQPGLVSQQTSEQFHAAPYKTGR